MPPSPSGPQSPSPNDGPPDRDAEATTFTLQATTQTRSPILQQPPQSQSQPEPPASTATIRPPFAPFFTLITDNDTGVNHHPSNIHYLFTDDDPSILTSACLSTLEYGLDTNRHSHSRSPNLDSSSSGISQSSSSSTTNTEPVAERHGPENRVLVLDMDASGACVTHAHSLSSSWQILSTNLTPAPTWAESPSDAQTQSDAESTPNLMLRITGTDGKNGLGETGTGKLRDVKIDGEAFEALIQDFNERMKVLKTVVEAGQADVDSTEAEKKDGELEVEKEI